MLPRPSLAQDECIRSLPQHNLLIDSVAGSGKTTTILHFANAYPLSKFLVLTYNRKPKAETRDRAALLSLKNITIHSYHSLLVSDFLVEAYDDVSMIMTLREGEFTKRIPRYIEQYSVIIIDECQDLTPLYFSVVKHLLHKQNKHLIVLGDYNQSIFDFSGADGRYITQAPKLLATFSTKPWKTIHLTESFRITRQIAEFINKCCLKETRLVATRDGPDVDYRVVSTNKSETIEQLAQLIQDLLIAKTYQPGDIYVIAPSIRSTPNSPYKKPIVMLANVLGKRKIPIYIPGEDETPDEKCAQGKIVFSTFHQVKGLERKCVLVFNFDASYFGLFAQNAPPDRCPNIMYVALTRAKERLILIHDTDYGVLPFIDKNAIAPYLVNQPQYSDDKKTFSGSNYIGVTSLLRHIKAELVDDIIQTIKFAMINEPEDEIRIPKQIEVKNTKLIESVADINGYIIPAYHELQTTGRSTIVDFLHYESLSGESMLLRNLGPSLNDLRSENLRQRIYALTYLCNKYMAYIYHHSYRATIFNSNYNWLSAEMLNGCSKRLSVIGEAKYEVQLQYANPTPNPKLAFVLNGQADAISHTNQTIWEIKCGQFSYVHIIQLAIYAFMWEYAGNPKYRYCLHYPLTNTIFQITIDCDTMAKNIDRLYSSKYTAHRTLTDEEFLAANLLDT